MKFGCYVVSSAMACLTQFPNRSAFESFPYAPTRTPPGAHAFGCREFSTNNIGSRLSLKMNEFGMLSEVPEGEDIDTGGCDGGSGGAGFPVGSLSVGGGGGGVGVGGGVSGGMQLHSRYFGPMTEGSRSIGGELQY